MDVGKLRHRLTLLDLHTVCMGEEVTHQWAEARQVWGLVELSNKTNLFSRVGIGARDATITLRDTQRLSCFNAIRWAGRHLFLTSMTREGGFITAKAAVVNPSYWTATAVHFPGILTEKYLGYSQERPMAESTVTYVLVTPKVIRLRPSDLVSNLDTAPGTYVVTACHVIDPWKNEYEITRREEP